MTISSRIRSLKLQRVFTSGKDKENHLSNSNFGSRYLPVWWALPREGVRAKKFGMSLETQGIQTSRRYVLEFLPGCPGATEMFEEKKSFLTGLRCPGGGLFLRSRLPCTDPKSGLRPVMGKNGRKWILVPSGKGGKLAEKWVKNGHFPIFRPFSPPLFPDGANIHSSAIFFPFRAGGPIWGLYRAIGIASLFRGFLDPKKLTFDVRPFCQAEGSFYRIATLQPPQRSSWALRAQSWKRS